MPSEHSKLFHIANRAHIFLSPDGQPFATIPLNGNTVPLYSAMFRDWLTLAFEEHGYRPSASQYGAVLRRLDEEIQLRPVVFPVHTRAARQAPGTYRFDLANLDNEAIEVNGKQWSIVDNDNCRFRRPTSSIQYPVPHDNPVHFYKFLARLFTLKETDAQALSVWLVAAMLPDLTPPVLVITGTERDDAVSKLRTLIDPVTCPIMAMPHTEQQFGRLAVTNNVMAFTIGKQLSENRKAALNKLRTGIPVSLHEVSRSRDKSFAIIHRPIIIAADEAIQISPSQLTIEINETSRTHLDQIFAALLHEIVRGIHEMMQKPEKSIFTYPDLLPTPPPQVPQTQAPYT